MSTTPQPITSQTDPQVASFASKIRAKFPGAYDDLKDDELATKIVTKHPEYSDMLPKGYGQKKPLPNYASGQQAQPGDVQQKPGGPIYNTKTNPPPPVPSTLGQKMAKGGSEGIASGLGISTPQPNQSLPRYMLQSAGEMGKNLLPILKDPLSGISHGIDSMATNIEDAGRKIYHGLGSPGIIPDRQSMMKMNPEEISHGAGQLVGTAAPVVAGMRGDAPEGPGIRRTIGSKVFNTEGKLTPLGDAISHPIEKGTEFGLRKLFPPPQPEGVGATEPSAGEFYENKGKDLMRRGTQQATLDRAAARAIPKPVKGVMSVGEGGPQTLSNVGRDTPFESPQPMNPVKQVGATSTTGPEVKMVSKIEPMKPSGIVSPDSLPPTQEGSYWSFKEDALRKAVLSGDRHAAVIYQTRFGQMPEGAKYLTDVGSRPTRGLYQNDK